MEKEYEAKSLLNEADFNKLLTYFKEHYNVSKMVLENYYLETIEQYFKENNSALRIRITNKNVAEITLKIRHENGNDEYNTPISINTARNILNKHDLNPNEYSLPLTESFENLNIDKMITTRYQIAIDENIICLDHCEYNDYFDFEIEVESTSVQDADKCLLDILNKHDIAFTKSKPKIARLKAYKKNEAK